MCGRYVLFTGERALETRFGARIEHGALSARYNAAPAQVMPVVLASGPGAAVSMRWGMRPVWWKWKGRRLINIKCETLKEKKVFSRLLRERRCLVLANGFYEWKRGDGRAQPFLFTLEGRRPYAFAGLWDGPNAGEPESAFAIITVPANALVSSVHGRMPCILEAWQERIWLDPGVGEEDLLRVLAPYPAAKMERRPVSDRVNWPTVDDPGLVEPLP